MLNIAAINSLIKTELRKTYTGIDIHLEGQSKISPASPRIMYTLLDEGRHPRKGTERALTNSEAGVAGITYTDHVYSKYRYSIIANEDAQTSTGGSYIKLVRAVSDKLYWYLRTQAFEISMETLGLRHTLNTGLQDGTISRLPFNEKRYFFDITYGHIDTYTQAEGSFIDTVEYTEDPYEIPN